MPTKQTISYIHNRYASTNDALKQANQILAESYGIKIVSLIQLARKYGATLDECGKAVAGPKGKRQNAHEYIKKYGGAS